MVDHNPASRWDEGTEIHGLTSYDINRTIRKLSAAKQKEKTIEISDEVIESLFSEDLKCRVCLGVLESTLATTCLHRFCSECLHRSLRMELGPKMHHECPSCRAKLASRRASKPDSKFDRLVQIFSGTKRSADEMMNPLLDDLQAQKGSASSSGGVDLKKYRDMHKQNVIKFKEKQKQLNGTGRNNASSSSRKAMNAAYSGFEGTGNKKGAAAAKAAASAAAAASAQNKVWLKLQPPPEWSPETSLQNVKYDVSALKATDKGKVELSHPYLRVPPYKTILSLKAYLMQKFNCTGEVVNVDILGNFKNKLTVLDDALSVLDMTTKNWDARSELILYFQTQSQISQRV